MIADSSEMQLFSKISMQDFLRKGLLEINPFIEKHIDSEDFKYYYDRISLVMRELIFKSLRNSSR